MINNGPRTAWFRRLSRTVEDLQGHEPKADDTDRFFLAWDEWCREVGGKLDRALSIGRTMLTGSHDEQCEGLRVLARLVGASGERPIRAEQSATDCRWTWSTVKRGERRVWEVKTGEPNPVDRDDVDQLLGQIEVETKRALKTRTYADRSLYLGLDPNFASILADPAVRASIPEGTGPTVRAALELYDQGWSATIDACRTFWQTPAPSSGAAESASLAAPGRKSRPGRSAGGSGDVASADAEVSAATDLWMGVGAVGAAQRLGHPLANAMTHEAGVAEVGDHEPLELTAGLWDRGDDDELADLAREVQAVVTASGGADNHRFMSTQRTTGSGLAESRRR
ncbi:hypothetical protein SAMN05192558_1258 [Actinokineospora alba]|uniref:Uncharacterized protein n=1 Tax=Actinokineospora alba TaxID=504798 RepID=A0A1H0WMJ5_9PSEU|nr:hypothetical protein [Actinokineospora alba]TDP67159.1 hypothetical protein C8E96_2683 [Actinokineospora alba]SDJ53459.1 hypothetical protein SAMN05421871_1198 [Actinokineospora alba]SDP91924.1 hypothetical protein SAMN05192558_1258 [Actinokineospora alba]